VQIDPDDGEPWLAVGRLHSALNHTARLLAQSSEVTAEYKRALSPRIVRAQRECDEIQKRVRGPEALKLFADLWQDRQYKPSATPAAVTHGRGRRYVPGMVVEHATFGRGVVQEVVPAGSDSTVVVRFEDGSEKKFLAKLVRDKLLPAR